MKVAVVGLGYVGSNLAKAAKSVGYDVLGVEIDSKRLIELSDSDYLVTSDFSQVADASIVVIAVPTPLDSFRQPDLGPLLEACGSVSGFIRPGVLIINESTSFPGTLRDLIAPLFEEGVLLASAPERIDPGNQTWNLMNTPRIVSGLSEEATTRASEFYRAFCQSVIEVSSPEVAEAAKIFENTFRQVNIALVNEFAQIAEKLNISTFEVIDAAATKPYGFIPFFPSVGVGGHCIPVDPSYLSFAARKVGAPARFIELANEINLDMPKYIAARIDQEYGVSGRQIQIAGIAYKPGVADVRESPAISLIEALRKKGGIVTWHDDFVEKNGDENSLPISPVDIGVICTAHPGVNYDAWKSRTKVVDVSTTAGTLWKKFL